MSKIINIIVSLMFLFICCQACDSPPPAPQPQKKAQKKKPEAPRPEKAAKKTGEKKYVPWPPDKDGKGVEIAKNLLSKNYYVVLDCSGSMEDKGCSGGLSKLEAAKNALSKFAGLVPANSNLGLMVFYAGKIYEMVPLGTENRDKFTSAVVSTKPGGGTPLFAAMRAGYMNIEKQARKQLGYGEYTLVIVTDGEASSGQDPTRIVHWILDNSPVQIHTIGFCIGNKHSLNIPGRVVYKPADNPEKLEQGLHDVLAEAEQFDVADFTKQ